MPTNSLPQDLAAQLSCERLLVRLFHCLDARDYEGVAACFDEDSLWLRQGKELRGPAQVLAALRERSATMHVHHMMSSIDVRLSSSERAESTAYMTVYRSDTGKAPQFPVHKPGPDLIAVCRSRLRLAGGQWRVSFMETQITYSAGA